MRLFLFAFLMFGTIFCAAQSKSSKPDLTGKHRLTLQWISLTDAGSIQFRKTAKDTYAVEGEQSGKNGCDSCHLRISGTVICADAKTLKFSGRMETVVDILQHGEPCVKEGAFVFKATGTRKYWRCQDMKSCGTEVNYVDIYFK